MQKVLHGHSLISDYDIHLFKEGNHFSLYKKLGAHLTEFDGQSGVYFAVWAPNAEKVSVIGDFNHWESETHLLASRWDSSGIWEGFIPGLELGALYKFSIFSKDKQLLQKQDPFGFYFEQPPKTASVVWQSDYQWQDKNWIETERASKQKHDQPWSVYELHLGSWKQKGPEDFYNYREIANELIPYIKDLGFTHIELLPVMEHPFYGSWGYQVLGYFAPTSRFGTPDDFKFFVDQCHQNSIGVILDWVPSHFPTDSHGLGLFDGTHLFEHADPKKGFHPDWKSFVFNHGRNEIKEFLISNACYWIEEFHIDGLRVDAVASMLYLDYSRENGEWIPNEFGGRENLDAIAFLQRLNSHLYGTYPGIQVIAEESTAWPGVSKPVDLGGLGFGFKWNMGWMHDTLLYFSKDPIHRKYHHNELTFSLLYAFHENFVLSLSHDEVVHGKGSMVSKMPGDDWQKMANLRLLYGYMYAHPGKKLLFMSCEFGQWEEWNHNFAINWHQLEHENHKGIYNWMKDLNHFYQNQPPLYEVDFEGSGFEWIDASDVNQSVISFMRYSQDRKESILVVCNMTPQVHDAYRIGVKEAGYWKVCLNSDQKSYGGSGLDLPDGIQSENNPLHGCEHSISLKLPSLSTLFLKKS